MMNMAAQQLPHQQPHQQPQHGYQPQQAPTGTLSYSTGQSANDHIGTRNGRTYRLVVEQQPIRARMCGFGDKDRRPITPPPCVRLVVCDAKTGAEIDVNDVDSSFFVLMVDLWHEDASRAVNLVRHSSAAPTVSISSSTVTSYPPPPERTMYMPAPLPYEAYGNTMPSRQMPSGYYAPSPMPGAYNQYSNSSTFGANPVVAYNAPIPASNQNHTRNLIGMNAVNACRLNDPAGKPGFWFVLQDLSVRTEGAFRLKLSMCDISTGQGSNAVVSTGKCPVLASNFSSAFTVYSAKKFPGVIESTTLSKCFAQQGIKIPIRKDGPKTLPNSGEYENDD